MKTYLIVSAAVLALFPAFASEGFPKAHMDRILHWEGVGNGGDILRRIGTNNISKAYAIDCGFTREDIAKFRSIMLEQ